MQIAPRYDGPVIVELAGGTGTAAELGRALVRQRRRLHATLAALDDEGWQAASRCEGWTVQDVAAHVDGVDRFWLHSIDNALAGTPTRMLDGFDPKTTPAAMVDAARSATPAETLAGLVEAGEALCGAVEALDDAGWSAVAEAPAGHVAVRVLAHHALWDCWVHERDAALPLGLAVPEEPDEVRACLRFVAALGPAFALTQGTARPATLVLEATGPDTRVVVEVTDRVVVHEGAGAAAGDAAVVLRGPAVELVEALSARAPLPGAVPADDLWLVATLGRVFESV